MDLLEICKAIKEVGIPIGSFVLCAWIVIFIVKRLARVIDKLNENLTLFMSKVKEEHKQSADQHKGMQEEHKEMIKVLGRINGYTK